MHTSFEDSDTLGKFNADCAAIGRHFDARTEELRAAYQRIAELEADLHEIREFLEDQADVNDGSYGEPSPNRAMSLVTMIDMSLHGPGGF